MLGGPKLKFRLMAGGDLAAFLPDTMTGRVSQVVDGLRLAELLAALSLATDLGMGQPLEEALRTCLIALSLGDRLGLQPDDLSDVYYVALLPFSWLRRRRRRIGRDCWRRRYWAPRGDCASAERSAG